VAHEINQPLSRILLQSRLAASGGKTGKSALRSLITEAETVVATIEKMKVLLRNVETSHQRVSLSLVIKNSLRQLKQPIALHWIEIEQLGPRRGCSIQGDSVQLQLAVMNLLRNAIEAMAENQSRPRKISIELRKAPDSIQLVIGDSGPGWSGGSIDETLLQSSKPDGSGLGLYIVKTNMENHNGQLDVGRSPLGGAEFRMVFPL
jgi:C4-dicarboxylate-specific signal transduction histidine kinase